MAHNRAAPQAERLQASRELMLRQRSFSLSTKRGR